MSSMVMAAIGTGIGGGVIIDNELLIGKDGSAGEFGHINVVPGGVLCGWGGGFCELPRSNFLKNIKFFLTF